MLQSFCTPIDGPGLTRRQLERELSRPRTFWDPLSRCYVPTPLRVDREARELARGDVMLSGPWGYRGDALALRESDRHERVRLAVMGALGYYDWHAEPDFRAPSYERRRERARDILCETWLASHGLMSFVSPTETLPWHYTGGADGVATSCYDPRSGVTLDGSSRVDTLEDLGTRGFDATNASSTLTVTANWVGASDWKLHNATDWTVVIAAQVTDTSASHVLFANRNQLTGTTLGITAAYVVGSGYRIQAANGSGAVWTLSPETALPDAFVGPMILGFRTGSGAVAGHVRSAGVLQSPTDTHSSPSNSDASILSLCSRPGGSSPLLGKLGLVGIRLDNYATILIAMGDWARAVARI